MTGRLGARLYALLAIVILAFTAAPALAQWSPPAVIDPAAFGPPTFRDDFGVLDAGPDATAKDARYRWRTISKPCVGWTVLSPKVHDCRTAGSQGLYGDASIGLDPFRVKDGKLYIDIKPLPKTHADRWGRGFLSGYLTTKFSFAQTTGYFEARLAVPAGKGMLPAFWLMPIVSQWPAGGEIDVMENIGDDRIYFASFHSKPAGKVVHSTATIKVATTLSRAYHRYGVAITPTELVWYFDGKQVRRAPRPADMIGPFYLILNVATGHSWPGPMKVKSGRMAIDYVSVWQVPDATTSYTP